LYAVNLSVHPLHLLISDVDLGVYRDAGFVARRSPGQLYNWQQSPGVRFTYTPFAAVLCVVLSALPWGLATWLMLTGSAICLLQAMWLTIGALGWEGSARLGLACAVGAVAFWMEPVQRTLHVGEVDLLLMLLVVTDLVMWRRWQGAGVGIAAGIKLVALIFIPYFLITGRYRQAVTAAGTFAATAVAGAVLLPRASAAWWLGGAFLDPGRVGFAGYVSNQSLLGMASRLVGTVIPGAAWLVLAVVAGGAGLIMAARADRLGLPVHGWVVCALTGLLVSPVSWDHHWIWIAPALAVLTDSAIRAGGVLRAAGWMAAGLVTVAFAAWPSQWLGDGTGLPWGLIWHAPSTPYELGVVHPEYHWGGLMLLVGNLYVLVGLAMLAAAAITTASLQRAKHRPVWPGSRKHSAAQHQAAAEPATTPVRRVDPCK
jgi:alpha-1,2-mannosyltransferase